MDARHQPKIAGAGPNNTIVAKARICCRSIIATISAENRLKNKAAVHKKQRLYV